MSDEKGKKAGAISKFKQQYGQIGSSKRPNNEELEAQNIQNSKSSDIQTSKPLNIQSVEGSAFQNAESPDIQRSEVSEVQNVESPSIQNLNTPDIQRSETLEVQTSEPLDIYNSEMLKGQNVNSLADQTSKGTHKGRTQKTIYLPPALAKRLNFAAVEEEREISEIVTDALEAYFKNKTKGSN